jgi:hypothetical protein
VFERRGERRFRRRNDVVRHRKQNSTRAGEGSTEGMGGRVRGGEDSWDEWMG